MLELVSPGALLPPNEPVPAGGIDVVGGLIHINHKDMKENLPKIELIRLKLCLVYFLDLLRSSGHAKLKSTSVGALLSSCR